MICSIIWDQVFIILKDNNHMKIDINVDDMANKLSRFDEAIATPVANGILQDGRKYQVQIVITTDKFKFIESKEIPNL